MSENFLPPQVVHKIDQRTGECSAGLAEMVNTYRMLKASHGSARVTMQMCGYIARKLGLGDKPEGEHTALELSALSMIDLLVTAIGQLSEQQPEALVRSMTDDELNLMSQDLLALNWPGVDWDHLPERVRQQYWRKAVKLSEKNWGRK